jgi:hypothetical protein
VKFPTKWLPRFFLFLALPRNASDRGHSSDIIHKIITKWQFNEDRLYDLKFLKLFWIVFMIKFFLPAFDTLAVLSPMTKNHSLFFHLNYTWKQNKRFLTRQINNYPCYFVFIIGQFICFIHENLLINMFRHFSNLKHITRGQFFLSKIVFKSNNVFYYFTIRLD